MQVKTGIRFYRADINYFKIKRLHAYIKQIICEGIEFWWKFQYEIDYIPKIDQRQAVREQIIHNFYPQFSSAILSSVMSFYKKAKIFSSQFHVLRILLHAHI